MIDTELRAVVIRTQNLPDRRLGVMWTAKGVDTPPARLYTLELPDRGNQRRISCIPAGTYKCEYQDHPHFGPCLRVFDVPGRSEIFAHWGGKPSNTLGCILFGLREIDIDGDGRPELVEQDAGRQVIKRVWGPNGKGVLVVVDLA